MDRKSGGFVLKSLCSESAAVLGLGFLALCVQTAHAQGPLNYFKNYLVTGDYAVGGVGLYGKAVNGSVTGTINFSGVPCTSGPGFFASVQPCTENGALPADVVAAFLYWQAIEPTAMPSYAAGTFDTNPFISVALGNTNVPSCTAGGGTQSGPYARVYRADVLRYLPINAAANVRMANGAHTIQLKSNAAGTQFTGATLVVVYRLVTPGNPRIASLRSVVLYDGVFTGTSSLGLNQTMGGLVQASGDAKMTQVAGNGQPISRGESETLWINGGAPQGVPANPFVGAQGANWDNYTFNYNLSPNASSVETQVRLTNACLSWAAIVTSTNVQDTDFDGLPDVWETSGLTLNPGVRNDGTPVPTQPVPATFGTCASPSSTNCVNLPAMGANPFIPDIFMQIDWMQSTGLTNPDHVHNPQLAALNMVGSAFKSHGINLHFDVGVSNTYQNQGSPYIIPKQYAQGGNIVLESSVLCKTPSCNFSPESGQYSVLGWKTGFDAIKNGDPSFPCPIYPVNSSCTPTPLPQLFAANRKDTFHYALFAHAIAATSPLSTPFPASISGVADRPGGDLMVTLGLWRSDIAANDQVGTTLQQAGTLMHELGHNLDLSHAGWNTTPNCMPDYPSTMNYLYQTRGLTDSAGNEHIDYSYGLEFPLSEGFLSSSFPMGIFQNYRVRYFGPLNSAVNSQGQASLVHCDGTLLSTGAAEGQYVRLEGPSVSTPDWSNGTILPLGKLIETGLDINYNGILGETFTDQPDWISLNLQQVGARPNADGLSLNIGVSDIGVSDIGVSDIGVSDIGVSDIGVSDIGVSDIGVSDIGTANLGQDSLGDEDFTTHLLSGVDPPTSLTAVVQSITPAVQVNGNQLNWTPPATGTVSQYNVYRCNASAAACTPAPPYFAVTPAGTPAPAVYVDTPNDFVHAGATCPAKSTCYNTTYTYYVTAVVNVVVGNGPMMPSESGSSNTVTSQVNHLFVIANNEAVTYGSANPAATFNVYGNVSGSLAAGAATCSYPNPAINAGNYPITCSGPATTSATDGVTYNAAYLTYTPGSLTINPRPITVTAAASAKVYDAGTSSPATPTITTGSLAYSDAPSFTETYDNKNVGTAHVMSPAGTVTDGNGGKNYAITFVTINTGVITRAPLTIAASANTKTYDGTTTAAAIPAVTGLKGSDTVTGLIETYNTSNAGQNLVLTVSAGYTVNDGNGGNNYTAATTTNSTGVINQAPLTASITAANKFYDGTTAATITGCSLTGVLPVDTGNVTCSAGGGAFASANAGTWAVTATASLAGTAAGNYALTSAVAGTTATISPAPVTVSLTNLMQTYTGGPLMPTVTTNPAAVAVSLTGAPAIAAGSYPVAAMVTNPNYTGSANGLFVIGPYPLTVTATGVNKNFDGTTNATVTLSDNRLSLNDTFTDSYVSASFSDPNPGAGKPVSVTGISISGTGATNYTLTSTTAATTANISDSINLMALALNGVNYASVPYAPALPTLNGNALQLTNATTETASAWLGTAIPVNSAFTTTFQFQITPAATSANSIGDGFAFVIQAAQTGNATLGTTGMGAYIGYAGIPNSIAVEFDTYQNTPLGDPAGSHIGIQSLGMQPNTSDHTNAAANLGGPVQVGFADGNPHSATITYNGTTLSVFVDGNPVPVVSASVALGSLPGLSAGTNAFVGFTAATGAAQENSNILGWSWN
ncbi:MAG: YDG domain-containing protein [Bryobacteraceae bacterium]|jgi:hypothetical protein